MGMRRQSEDLNGCSQLSRRVYHLRRKASEGPSRQIDRRNQDSAATVSFHRYRMLRQTGRPGFTPSGSLHLFRPVSPKDSHFGALFSMWHYRIIYCGGII